MAPCDPYMEPMYWPSPHERLEGMLPLRDGPVTIDVSATPKAGMAHIPQEVMSKVFKYVKCKHDLAQLCKVNKRFFATALPFLYHNIEFKITGMLDPTFTQMFTIENTGLRYIRSMTVFSDASLGPGASAVHQWLQIVINQIAKDTLSYFRWDIPHPLQTNTLKILWQRQRKLKRIEIVPSLTSHASWQLDEQGRLAAHIVSRSFVSEINKIDFSNLRAVRAIVDTTATAQLSCAALQRGKVTELEVDARLWQHGDAREDEVVQEDDGEQGTVVRDMLTQFLFGHMERVKPGHIPRHDTFTTFTLKDINLELSKHTWYTYLDLCHLKHLKLEHCPGADIFLMRLASGASSPKLQSFSLVHDLGHHSDRTIHAVEELLSFPRDSVRKLELCLRNAPQLPKVASILAHKKTLERLLLDVEGTNVIAEVNDWGVATPNENDKLLQYDTGRFSSIVESCTSLVELGIPFPAVGVEYASFSQDCADFTKWMDLISNNLKLLTLNVLNWPSNYKYGREHGYYIAKNLQLARLAADIFERFRQYDHEEGLSILEERKTSLEIIAFGVHELGRRMPQPVYFLQSEVKLLGKTHKNAYSVTLKTLRDWDMDIEVIDYGVRDFEKMSRKTFGESRKWHVMGQNGGGPTW